MVPLFLLLFVLSEHNYIFHRYYYNPYRLLCQTITRLIIIILQSAFGIGLLERSCTVFCEQQTGFCDIVVKIKAVMQTHLVFVELKSVWLPTLLFKGSNSISLFCVMCRDKHLPSIGNWNIKPNEMKDVHNKNLFNSVSFNFISLPKTMIMFTIMICISVDFTVIYLNSNFY